MASTWIYRNVRYKSEKTDDGWTLWSPDFDSLAKALDEIVTDANNMNCRITSMTYLPQQAGKDFDIKLIAPSGGFNYHENAGLSHKVYSWGVTIVAFLEQC